MGVGEKKSFAHGVNCDLGPGQTVLIDTKSSSTLRWNCFLMEPFVDH